MCCVVFVLVFTYSWQLLFDGCFSIWVVLGVLVYYNSVVCYVVVFILLCFGCLLLLFILFVLLLVCVWGVSLFGLFVLLVFVWCLTVGFG